MKFLTWIILVLVACSPAISADATARLELNQQGDPLFTLIQEDRPLSISPRLSIHWGQDKPQHYQGFLYSSWWHQDQLLLIYPRSIFLAQQGAKLQLLKKAPKDKIFISLGKAFEGQNGHFTLLKNIKDGRFFRQIEDGSFLPIPALEQYKGLSIHQSWASSQHPLITFPQQKDLEIDTICFFSPDFETCRFIQMEAPGLPVGISETERGLWLLPQEGIQAKLWNGKSLNSEKLPVISPKASWLACAEAELGHLQAIIEDEHGLAYWNGKESMNISEPTSVVKKTNDRPIWLQLLLFSVMMSSFLIILRWRQDAMLDRRNKEKKVPITASIWSRSLAFMMDSFILYTPTYIICTLLGFPQPPAIGFNSFFSLPLHQQTEIINLLYAFITILIILFPFYNGILEYTLGASLGKLFFNIRVESTQGIHLSWRQVIIRNMVRSLDFILPIPPSLISALFHKEKRSFADRLSSTRVVKIL